MNIDLRPRRLLLLAGTLLLAFSAATHAEPPPYAAHVDNARKASYDGHYAEASRAFEAAAKTSSAPFTAEFLLSAAEAALKSGDAARAELLCAQIPSGSLDTTQMARLNAVRAVAQTTAPTDAAPPAAAAPAPVLAPVQPSLPASTGLALILPLSGTLAPTAEAVRDGFMAAALKNPNHLPVRLYDSGNSNESSLAAYQQALREGASFVVGPLRKESIAAIAALGQMQVPVLALNYLDEAARVPPNFFQFGLAPEDEARAAAEHAVAQGKKFAVALVPQTEWGDRVFAAFEKRLRELGGGVRRSARYKVGTVDFSKSIQGLMKLEPVPNSNNGVAPAVASKKPVELRPRGDFDFIFMPARASDAHMIWPQFRFYRGTGLPVYATSMIYGGSGDNELSSVNFCDMPMMLQADSTWAGVRADAADLPAIKTQPRLFALGYDAYNLVGLMQSGKIQTGAVIPAASGGLVMRSNGAINRTLGCAQFRDGGIRASDASTSAQ
ncbi:MAG: penicillin-binding protein activator [Pseudomonadota bacterium]